MKEKTFILEKSGLQKFALLFLKDVVPLLSERAGYVALHGDLGAGKTAFVKEVATLLGVKEEVVSPTFILKKEYETETKEVEKLVHIDAYRLTEKKEGAVLRLADDNEKGVLIFIEWPEHIDPLPYIAHISLEYKDETSRSVHYVVNEK